MTVSEKKNLLAVAVKAAHAAGDIMRRNRLASKKINEATQRDIKLELDVRCQRKIESMLTKAHPELAVLGEECRRNRERAALGGRPDRRHGEFHLRHSARLRVDRAAAALGQAEQIWGELRNDHRCGVRSVCGRTLDGDQGPSGQAQRQTDTSKRRAAERSHAVDRLCQGQKNDGLHDPVLQQVGVENSQAANDGFGDVGADVRGLRPLSRLHRVEGQPVGYCRRRACS